MKLRVSTAAAALLGVLVVLFPTPSEACATCSCGDPTLAAVGSDIPFAGRVRAYSGLRLWSAETDQGSVREARLDVVGTWSATSWLVIGLAAPLQLRELDTGAGAPLQGFGAGDLQFTARALAFRDRSFSPNHLVSVFAGLEMPTATLVRDGTGARAPLDAQLGSGSWDPLLGAGYAYFNGPWSGSFDVRALLPTDGFAGHREGMSAIGTLAAQYQPWTWLGFRLSTETRVEGPESAGTSEHADPASSSQALYVQAHNGVDHGTGASHASGGWVAFASPGVVVSPVQDLMLQLAVHLPVVDTTAHEAGPVMQLGATWDF